MLAVCPEEEALLCLVLGESDEDLEDMRAHTNACGACRQRVRELEDEIRTLREMTRELVRAEAASPPRRDRLPDIGKYIVVGCLGSGGQAEVYRGLDPTLGREVAIKWSRHELGPAREDRLTQEGRDLCQLNHAHLVRVFELGVQDDRPYLVMEYIRGCTLEQLIHDKPLPPKQSAVRAAQVLLPVARALAEVHRRGLVHLDLKPHNILIDNEGQPFLTDFGLARHFDEGGVNADRPLGGTPGYMAPEQAAGQAHRIGPRTDVFGLGAVLYRLLVGQPPFPGDESMRVLQDTAAGKLDLSPLGSARPPRRLAAICRRALAVDPQQRYPDAKALADDLQRFLRRWVLHTALVGTGVALLAAGGLGYMLQPATPRPDFPKGPQYLIHQVRRGKQDTQDLLKALPLRTGDQYKLICPVPAGYRVALFWFDAAGELQELPNVHTVPAGQFDELTYPADEKLNELSGKTGTNLVLLCAGPGRPPSRADLEPLLASDGPLPQLPVWYEKIAFCLDRDQVQEYSEEKLRPVNQVEGDPRSVLEARLKKLRLKLRDRWPFLAGVAVQQR
jgi:hypothetical protein